MIDILKPELQIEQHEESGTWVLYANGTIPLAHCNSEVEASFVKEWYERWYSMLERIVSGYNAVFPVPFLDEWHGSVEELEALEQAWSNHGAAAAKDGLCG
jgi:hypothetical protein